MPADLVTVTGTVTDAARVPVRGRVGLRPLAAAVDTTTPQALITDNTVSVGLDDTGAFTLHVTASDDGGWRTTGPVPYLVSLEVLGRPRRAWTVLVPGPGPHDLWDLVALDEPPGVVTVPGGAGGGAAALDTLYPGWRPYDPAATYEAGDYVLSDGLMWLARETIRPGDSERPTAANQGDWFYGPQDIPTTREALDDLAGQVSAAKIMASSAQSRAREAVPVDMLHGVFAWSATTQYHRGDMVKVAGVDSVDYFTSDVDQVGGTAPSRTNLDTWTPVDGFSMLFFGDRQVREQFGDPTLLTQTHPAHDLVHWLVWLEGRVTAVEAGGGGGPTVPTAEGTLEVDMYSGSFVRARDTGTVLTDGQPHWVDFALATVPGTGGAVIDPVAGVPAGTAKTWFDRGGQLGGVVGPTGTDVTQTTMRNWVKYGRDAAPGQAHYVLLAHVDTTVEPGHPRLVISNVVTIG